MSNRHMSSRSGHAEDAQGVILQDSLADIISGQKAVTHMPHFLPLWFPFSTLLLFCLLCPLETSILIFIYLYLFSVTLFFSHTWPFHSSMLVSSRPPSFPSVSSLLHLSYLSPFSLCSLSSGPQRFFKLLLHFNGRFLFTLQVKQCN